MEGNINYKLRMFRLYVNFVFKSIERRVKLILRTFFVHSFFTTYGMNATKIFINLFEGKKDNSF